MAEGEDEDTDGSFYSPAVLDENSGEVGDTVHIDESTLREINHENDRHDYFVCRKTEDKAEEDSAVKPHKVTERFEKI